MVAHAPGADPGAVVYDALDAAVARGADLVIADTAGRLHTKSNLMDELPKIRRIIDKRLPGARPRDAVRPRCDHRPERADPGQGLPRGRRPHRASSSRSSIRPSKGGIVFAIERELGVPVRFVGVGEQASDLIAFDPDAFVEALFA